MTVEIPSRVAIERARQVLQPYVRRTPVWALRDPWVDARLGAGTEAWLKLELFQRTGSFKPRGALLRALDVPEEQRQRGFTAVSAGNHAMAVAFAAATLSTTAKVVMPRTASPFRIEGARTLGAEVVLVDDVHRAFEEVRRIEREEQRTFIHPFEGPAVALGTATVGDELLDDVPELDAVIVPIGGGGLCAGIAAAVKQRRPACRVIGVEPTGADSMHKSFAAGQPMAIDAVRTIADSLGAPRAEPHSFELCRRFVDELVLVDDDQIRAAMSVLFSVAKLAVEPAGAAATAALLGPARRQLAGRRVGVIVCGANIDVEGFASAVARGNLVRDTAFDRPPQPPAPVS